jgi:hypothetical protein
MVNNWKWAAIILGCMVWMNPSVSTANHVDYQNGYYAGHYDRINAPADTTRCRTSYISPAHGPANTRDWNDGYLAGLRSHTGRNTITYQTRQLQLQTSYLTELSPSIRPYKQPIMQPCRPGIHPLSLPIRPASSGPSPLCRPSSYAAYGPSRPSPVFRPLDQPAHPGPKPFCPYPRK